MDKLALTQVEHLPPLASEIIEIRKWSDLFDRPNHVACIDARHKDLLQIIGRYEGLRPLKPCGLKSCRSEHGNGFLIILRNGQETHIGQYCGVTHFGTDAFKLAHGSFKKAVNQKSYRQSIKAALTKVPEWRQRIRRIRLFGDSNAGICHKRMHHQMTVLFEESTRQGLHRLAASGNGWITEDKELDADQRHLGGGSNYVTERVYLVAGIRAVSTYQELAPRNFDKILSELVDLQSIDTDTANLETLKLWNRKVGRMDGRIQDLSDALEDCRRFLSERNIEAIVQHRRLINSSLAKRY